MERKITGHGGSGPRSPKSPSWGPFHIKKSRPILALKKVIFSPFAKFFWSCLGNVWALFSVVKVLLFYSSKGSYIIPKIDILVTFVFQEDHSDDFGITKVVLKAWCGNLERKITGHGGSGPRSPSWGPFHIKKKSSAALSRFVPRLI